MFFFNFCMALPIFRGIFVIDWVQVYLSPGIYNKEGMWLGWGDVTQMCFHVIVLFGVYTKTKGSCTQTTRALSKWAKNLSFLPIFDGWRVKKNQFDQQCIQKWRQNLKFSENALGGLRAVLYFIKYSTPSCHPIGDI